LTVDGDLAEALSRLEALLARAGAAIVPVLHEGIDEPEVVRLLDGVGLPATSEVVTWFGWHDGAGERGMPSTVIEIVPGGEFYDLGHLCGEYVTTRSIAAEVAAMLGVPFDAEQRWATSWFPLLRLFGKGFLAVDLAGGDGSMSPVRVVWHDDDPERRARVAWPSIAAFVEAVIERFEAGVYSVDGDGIVRGPTIGFPD
jgi:cell wall assembly regulator SMI1